MMKTIVLRKNQLVLFSVIRFYSQRGLGGNLKMEMLLCLEWVGKRWRERGIVCMARHHFLRIVHLSIMSECVLQATVEFVLSATKLKWVIVFRQIITVMWAGFTSSLTSTTKQPHGGWSFNLISTYTFTNCSLFFLTHAILEQFKREAGTKKREDGRSVS